MNEEYGAARDTLLAEFSRRGPVQSEDVGHRYQEYCCSLFPGTPRELEIQLYAEDPEELEHEAIPLLRQLLTAIDDRRFMTEEKDATLAIVLLRQDRLGLHYWQVSVNNEFTKLFDRRQGVWTATGYGEFFDW